MRPMRCGKPPGFPWITVQKRGKLPVFPTDPSHPRGPCTGANTHMRTNRSVYSHEQSPGGMAPFTEDLGASQIPLPKMWGRYWVIHTIPCSTMITIIGSIHVS